jgi:hypothetical protein
MAVPGFDDTALQSDAYLAKAETILYYNNWMFDQDVIEQVGPKATPAGPNINFGIEYSHTDNGGTFAYADPMPESDDTTAVAAYFTKTAYQKAARTYGMLQAQEQGIGIRLPYSQSSISDMAAIEKTSRKLRAVITAAVILEFETQIDSAGSYGDNSLTRSSYGLASYEDTSGGDLTLAHLEDAIENGQGTTYGGVTDPAMEYDILLPQNQMTNLGRLGAGNVGESFNEANFLAMVRMDENGPIDAGRITRTKTFEGIRLRVVPGMTTTNILILRRGTNSIYNWWNLEVEPKDVAAKQRLYLITMGVNGICRVPTHNLKISGLNA